MQPTVSVIIPVYNEKQSIQECLLSLRKQDYPEIEIIVIDDGSTDGSLQVVEQIGDGTILHQEHQGPAMARNAAAQQARGDILVFVDADMTFDPRYISALVAPIIAGKTKGTFTKEEYVSNWDHVWARCWNHAQGIADKRRVPIDFPNTSPVFRAIQKAEFDRVHGYDPIGYTDDWTLSRKLGYQAIPAPGAICYHRNPDTLREIFQQSRWIGKNEFLSGSLFRRGYNAVRFFPPVQCLIGVGEAFRFATPAMIFFRLVYGSGIWWSVLTAWGERNK